MAQAVKRVKIEGDYAFQTARSNGKTMAREFFYAVAALNYIQSHVSPLVYAQLPTKPTSTEDVLRAGAGICGHQAIVFKDILDALQVSNRAVQFYSLDSVGSNHSAAEVYYKNRWHFFDPTNGAYFLGSNGLDDVMSAETMLDSKDAIRKIVLNQTDLAYQTNRLANINPLAYATPLTRNVLYEGTGELLLSAVSNQKEPNLYRFGNLPNFLGLYPLWPGKPPQSNIRYRLLNRGSISAVVLDVSHWNCEENTGAIQITSPEGQYSFPLPATEPSRITLTLPKPIQGAFSLELISASERYCFFRMEQVKTVGSGRAAKSSSAH